MTDNRFILNSAYDLNQMQEADSISSYYHSNAPLQMENVCNRVVILLTMCVNKELSIILANTDVSEKDYFIFLKKTYTEVCLKYQNINKRIITKLEISLSDNRTSRCCSKHCSDLHTFCNIIRMIDFFYRSGCQADLVTI